jgi:5-methyltetrahydrofolate--homocysteine methyltransferase
MIIIGERINSTRKSIKDAISRKDMDFLTDEAKRQLDSGASFIDINCAASMENETGDLTWLIKSLQQGLNCQISIDSPNAETIESAVKIHSGIPFINSITAEKDKLRRLLPVFKKTKSYIIALTIDENGMPNDVDGRITLAERIIKAVTEEGIERDSIYIDPLTKPISTEPDQPGYFLEAIRILKAKKIKTIGGLSNVSFGLPKRSILNAAFLKLAIDAGIDAAIIDPTERLANAVINKKSMPDELFLLARDALLGKDSYSANYIRAFRTGRLEI